MSVDSTPEGDQLAPISNGSSATGRETALIVEDDPADAELLISALGSMADHKHVVLVRTGEEALRYIAERCTRSEEHPRVVFLDIKLPRMTGIEVLARLKEDPAMCKVPTVMLTSSREERDIRRSYELGANGYVVKPVKFTEYQKTMRESWAYWMERNEVCLGKCGE